MSGKTDSYLGSVREGNHGAAPRNAWLVRLASGTKFDGCSIFVSGYSEARSAIESGDGVMVVDNETNKVVGLGRLYRERTTLEGKRFFFDATVSLDTAVEVISLGIDLADDGATVTRLDWSAFAAALKSAAGIDFTDMPVIGDRNARERAYLRELLQVAVMDDLLGPADGPHEEVVEMSVRDRYLVGKLAPPETSRDADQDEDLPDDAGSDGNEGDRETEASTSQSLVPSSIGFTFCVDADIESLEVEARWGRYERRESELYFNDETGNPLRAWKRVPSGGKRAVPLKEGDLAPLVPDEATPEVIVQGTVRPSLSNGSRLVTLFLVNKQSRPPENQDAAWVFQPELIVRAPERKPVFYRKPLLDDTSEEFSPEEKEERAALEMLYRKQVEFAAGHGTSVHAETEEGNTQRAVEIGTRVFPEYEVPVTETPGKAGEDRPALQRMVRDRWLDMAALAEMDRERLVSVLTSLADDYGEWIGEQRTRIGEEISGHDDAAGRAMDRCEVVLRRLREGAEVLRSDDKAVEAFRFANRAMALQRVRGLYALKKRRGETPDLETIDVPGNRSWRPFQLAFILLALPALADPNHPDRTEPLEAQADLLWFPTGGGKTEAYLGVAAFTMAIRRLQGKVGGFDGTRGLAVIMRYTLRLLTLQQFQRATTLICAMETIRRDDQETWGLEPFTIGLWVGQKVTPNDTDESHQAIERERDQRFLGGATPAQFNYCPWCGSEIAAGRDIRVDRVVKRTYIYCGDRFGRCDFGRAKSKELGLPVLVVDDEIYRHPPSMMIATVDKFAMMTWRGQVRTLFGKARKECPRHGLLWPDAECKTGHQKHGSLPPVQVRDIDPIRPPDLVIQDEFHLISGPLGTMVGLYESAVDELSSWELGGRKIRPKIVASTATVRKAPQQVHNVFLRRVSIFPPHGLDIEDNFFSVQRSTDTLPGRRYFGVCAPGSSRPAVLIRVYVSLLTAAQELFERFGKSADPYMTLVGYFNSLRELGGMRRLAEDDVQARAFRVLGTRSPRPGMTRRNLNSIDELTSRVQSREIPAKLDQLEIEHKPDRKKGDPRPIDIVLATNMLSVGVDVSRLGLMAVNGQPKNTAEYIQATSRVGRASPGLICTVLNWAKPRDLSHYETFEHYHATFYKHVEAQSVTPFAPRALDRGLTGTLVSLMRLPNDDLNPNLGAERLESTADPVANHAGQVLEERSWLVTDKRPIAERTKAMVSERVDKWVGEATKGGRRLGYEAKRKQGEVAGLLKRPGLQAWGLMTAPMSMREVEPGVRLIMDDSKLTDPPAWRARPADGGDDGVER